MKATKGTLIVHRRRAGQSLVEFALVLPLMVLIMAGIFDLGRAFFAYIAISNAAREGVRVFTFTPKKTAMLNMTNAIYAEIGASTVVNPANIVSIKFECVNRLTNTMAQIFNDTELRACKSEAPIRATITYTHPLILSFFFSAPLTLVRSAEMMVP